jgi:hypothetical protein
MDYLKLQKIGKLQMDLIEKIQSGKLESQALELQKTSVEDITKRELLLEDMNAQLKDMKALMLELYKMNEG